VSDADISIMFLQFFVYWRSDLKGPCSNVSQTRHVKLVAVCGLL